MAGGMAVGGSGGKDHPPATGYFIYVVIGFATIGAILFGLDQGNWAGAITKDGFIEAFCGSINDKKCVEEPYYAWYTTFLAWSSSLVQFGALFGAIFIGPPVAGKMGRHEAMFAGCLVTVIGVVPMCLVTDQYYFMVTRFITGIGVGIVTYALPMFISEVAPPAIRGTLGASFQLVMVIGMNIATQLNALPNDLFGYQASFSLPLYPAVILCLGIFCFPPSPRFVLMKYSDKEHEKLGDQKALDALLLLRGNQKAADFELAELKAHLKGEEDRPKGRWSTLYRDPSIFKRVLIANGLQWMQQFTGINALLSFGPTMLNEAKLEFDPQLGQVFINLCNLASTVIMMGLIDKFGRRALLLAGAAGMLFFMSAAAVISYCIKVLEMTNGTGILLLIILCGYMFSFGIGWGGVPWVYPSEIFPMDVKEMAMSTSVASQWFANAVIAALVPMQVQYFNLHGTFVFYAVCLAANFAVVYKFIPETKGLELEEMDVLFGPRLEEIDDDSSSSSGSDDYEE